MIDAGIVGLGWWGKNLVEAVQGKSDRLRFVRGACRETGLWRHSPRVMALRCRRR
jgi:hypothetical protein